MTERSQQGALAAEKRVHAIDMTFNLLCGTRGGNRTSVVRRPYDRDKLSKLVTCKRCKEIMRRG